MSSKKVGRGCDLDDDDFYDEEDWADDYDDYAEPSHQAKPPARVTSKQTKASPAGSANPPQKTAAAAGASALAQCIFGPPPTRPNGKPQKGGKTGAAAKMAAQAAQAMSADLRPAGIMDVQPFAFNTPSPDDRIQSAQRRGAVPLLEPRSNEVAQSEPAAAAATPPRTPASQVASTSAVLPGLQAMALCERPPSLAATSGAGPAPDAAAPVSGPASPLPPTRRPLAEYVMEPQLARACADAAAAEAGPGGGRSRLHLVVLGHVDAGKSTLMGRLLHDLGHVSAAAAAKHAREAAAAGKASFAWAWLLDERAEERARGVTVDVAQSRFLTPTHAVTLLDAPGHRDFVPNMIAGAAQGDAALLVVEGAAGGFEAGFTPGAPGLGAPGGGQTREHAQLARALGLEQLAVVITKLDTVAHPQARFEEVRGALLPFLRACGYAPASLQWLPAVGPSGDNVAAPPSAACLASWWRGPTLVQAIDKFKAPERATALPMRLPVSDVGRGPRGGVAVGGKLEAGALMAGMRVVVEPGGHVAAVRSMEVGGVSATLARAGDAAEVALTGMDVAVLGTGSVVCAAGWPVPTAARFQARVLVLSGAGPLLRGQQATLHAHAARESGHVSRLIALLHARSDEVAKPRPRALLAGQTALIEVTAERPLCLELYSDLRALGRIALRDGGRTLAVGVVTALLG